MPDGAIDESQRDGVPTPGSDTADPTPEPSSPAPEPSEEANDYPFPGKIAIITNHPDYGTEEYWSAQYLVNKYGSEKIVHKTWPSNFVQEGDPYYVTIPYWIIHEDPDIRAIIINRADIGTNFTVDRIMGYRDNLLFVYCNPAENPADVATRAHLILNTNDALRGETIITTAKAMGAEVFVHYSFPRHLGMRTIAARREVMMANCERMGILFVDIHAPDPTGPGGAQETQQFILEDVPRQIAEYGTNTAFFGTNCSMQAPLQRMVAVHGAIYPEPCCPSPYHFFPGTFNVIDRFFDGSVMGVDADRNPVDKGRLRPVSDFVGEIRRNIAARGATGRLATWPVPVSMLSTVIGTEYAIKWINGEVPRERGIIDYAAIEEICEAYIYETTGEHLGVELNPFSMSGRSYHNYVLILPDSIVF